MSNKETLKTTKLSNYLANSITDKGSRFMTYLSRVEAGQPKDYKTNFYGKETPREDILNSWQKILENGNLNPSLMQFENDLRAKVGPLSVMKPLKERMSDIGHYYEDVKLPVSYSDNVEIAQERVDLEFKGMRGLRQRSYDSTLEKMKKNTNSGTPFFTRRNEVLDPSLRALRTITDTGAEYSSLGWKDHAAILGWRGQEGGMESDDVKQRVIWMFPFAVNIAELSVYQPFIEAAKSLSLVPAWISMDAVDERITQLFDTAKGELIVCTDFSKFDQHFNVHMQGLAREFFKGCLFGGNSNDWFNVFKVKYEIPLICSPDIILTGSHGMASGSGGTNADETIAHRVLQHYAAIQHNSVLNPNSQCLGDDGLLSYPGITVDDVISAYESFGQECNKEKQYADTTTCVYLRRWHSINYKLDGICRGVYSTYRAIGRLTAQERFYRPEFWSPEMVALRQLSIIENVKWHPLRDQFAEWCMKGDKYRLGIDLPGFLDNMGKYVEEATNYMPDFLGYVRSQQADASGKSLREGINDWWIVKYLKSIA